MTWALKLRGLGSVKESVGEVQWEVVWVESGLGWSSVIVKRVCKGFGLLWRMFKNYQKGDDFEKHKSFCE